MPLPITVGFSLRGYVLEGPRVGAANSPYTPTPYVYISDFGAYGAAYPSSETAPRTDYLVMALTDGKLPAATFGWTKNEGLTATGAAVQRFDYDGRKQSFLPLKGAPPLALGPLASTANTTRLKVSTPIGVLAAAPFRLSVGATGSGVTLSTSLVTAFGSPSAGTVEILTLGANAGQLNWNAGDLVTYDGEQVKFQRQSYFSSKESNGKLGLMENNALLLNPIPGTGQSPLLRIGYDLWVTTVECVDESGFSVNPVAGTVEWALTTGMLKFNSGDLTTNANRAVYYDGTLFGKGLTLPSQSLGTVNASGVATPQGVVLSPMPLPGADVIFRVPGTIQFEEALLVTTLDPIGKQGQVQYNAGGQIQLSLADRTAYGGLALQVVIGDLPLERGLSMRFFRTPVDLAGADPTLKDVSTVYEIVNATWAEPILAMPQVFLPSLPIDSYPMTITVKQGTGSFLGALPRLDVAGPPPGFGYVIDFEGGLLQYANRHNNLLVTLPEATAIAVLPDPLLVDSQTSFALETAVGSGLYTTLVRDQDYLLDVTAGQVYFTTTFGPVRTSGPGGTTFGTTTFTDASADFVTSGILAGDLLVVTAGSAKGVYTVVTVNSSTQLTLDLSAAADTTVGYEVRASREVLVDRFFQEVEIVDPNTKIERIRTLGTITNSPRLAIPTARVTVTRFLFVDETVTTTTVVVNDGAFTSPGSLTAGTIEISAETGNLNFSSVDVVATRVAKWVFRLTQNKDYRISATLGFIEFTERMLTGEEGLITYTTPNAEGIVAEPVTFLVRKEQVQAHPTPVSTVTFNPLGHRIAANPPPSVFRGGRPQVTNTQVTIDTTLSSVTFLADTQLTDALPHGAVLAPIERVLVDYFIYDAIGGEKTTSVLLPPINLARILITGGTSSFVVIGDWTLSFPTDHLLRVDNDQVYLIGSSTYDGGTSLTTITLGGGQTFQDDFVDPKLYVTSGVTRTAAVAYTPAYFTTEMSAYETVARGMNIVKLVGDRTTSYKSNSVLLFTDGTLIDTYRVAGVRYNPDSNRTEVTLMANVRRQYGTHTLKYSVRPIVEAATTAVATTLNPVLTFPGDPTTPQYSLFRRVEGAVGVLLSTPADYTIEASGAIKITSPLLPREEFSIFYTGMRTVTAGLRLKSSYTNIAAPSATNGLLSQALTADFSTFSPDTFYFRVETMTNFRGETAKDFEAQAKANAPGGGPQTANTASPQLSEQGRESVFFQEGHLGNQDLIARSILKFYNDAVNDLEDALHTIDGRIVGDRHGRFKFDGNDNNPVRVNEATVTNEIDDRLTVSPFPLPDGTSQKIYLAGPYSRFFCTQRNLFAGPTLAGSEDGDVIAKFAFNKLTSLPGEARRRSQRAQVLKNYPAGTTTFEVDNATGTTDALLRPAFVNGMRVVIQDALGAFYINDAAQVTVTGVSAGPPQTITLSAGAAVPAGATIYLSPSDANSTLSDNAQNGYAMVYRFGKDIDASLDTGELLFIERAFPFDGTLPTLFIPKILLINEVPAGDILQVNGVGCSPLNVAPYRFPALDGGALDDDGDQALPLIGPTFDGEITAGGGGPLNIETGILAPVTGTIRTSTTPAYVGTGSLDVTCMIITDTVPFAGTLPQVDDLVRILSGLNGATSFHRITAVGASTVTVATAFPTQDTGFSYTIAVSATTVTGSATLSGTTMTDLFATFTSNGTKVGHTVVLTSGLDSGLRRQVAAINSDTVVTLSAAFPTAVGATYRVDNPLNTYSGLEVGSESSVLADEVAATTDADAAIDQFFIHVFTTIASGPATGTVDIGDLTVLTDLSATFITSGVLSSHFIYVPSGALLGVYKIASVDSETQITVASAFPSAGTLIEYLAVSAFGAGLSTFTDLIGIITNNSGFRTSTQAFQTLWNTAVSVDGDAGAFARSYVDTDLDARATGVAARLAYLANPALGPILKIQNALSGTERLYDKRYTWIDARINMEKGLLVKQTRAVENRIKAQVDTLNQLIKLLAVK